MGNAPPPPVLFREAGLKLDHPASRPAVVHHQGDAQGREHDQQHQRTQPKSSHGIASNYSTVRAFLPANDPVTVPRPLGEIKRFWTLSDFGEMPSTAVAQRLSRLARKGVIQRLGTGLYYRPRLTAFGLSRPNTVRQDIRPGLPRRGEVLTGETISGSLTTRFGAETDERIKATGKSGRPQGTKAGSRWEIRDDTTWFKNGLWRVTDRGWLGSSPARDESRTASDLGASPFGRRPQPPGTVTYF